MIDVLVITKDADGNLDATELSDLEDLGELEMLEAQLADDLDDELDDDLDETTGD